MPCDFTGKWKPVVNDGVDEYFHELGIDGMKRKAVKGAKQNITQKGDEMTVEVKVCAGPITIMTKTQKVVVGTDAEETDPMNRKMKVHPEWDGDKLVTRMECVDEDMQQVVTRELDGDEMKLEMEMFRKGQSVAKCTRRFQKE